MLKQFRSVFSIPIRAAKRAWSAIRAARVRWIPNPPRRFRRFILTLVLISILTAGAGWLIQFIGLDVSERSWSVSEVSAIAENRLKAIAATLDTVRERLARDPEILDGLASDNREKLFAALNERETDYTSRLPDSTLYFQTTTGLRAASRGYAVYSGSGKLLAWKSPSAATFGIDTLLSGWMLLPNRDQALMLENGPLYAYLLSIRKIISQDGQIEAYITTKQQLATKEPIANASASNFLDDLPAHARRIVSVTFGGRPNLDKSDAKWVRQNLLADPADPTSFIGTLSINRVQQTEGSFGNKVLKNVWSLALTLALLCGLLWFLIALAEVPPERKPFKARDLVFSHGVGGAFCYPCIAL